MKIKANTPYEIKYYLSTGQDKKVTTKTEDEILTSILLNARISRAHTSALAVSGGGELNPGPPACTC